MYSMLHVATEHERMCILCVTCLMLLACLRVFRSPRPPRRLWLLADTPKPICVVVMVVVAYMLCLTSTYEENEEYNI